MLPNRISFCLGLRGISTVIDVACASSFVALKLAVDSLRQGESESVLVCGSNLQLVPNLSQCLADLGILSVNGRSCSFDQSSNGYVRAEAVVVLFLQKRKDAKRIYANVEQVICNHDGFKPDGITHSDGKSQSELFKQFYDKIKVNPLDVHFVEAHATGTPIGDIEECSAIDRVFCKNRPEPLLVGSLKSNMGHAEAASGLVSIIKAIFAFESGLIAPNIHFSEIRREIPGLASGRMKVCTEATPLKGSYIAINNCGAGAVNTHALVRREVKQKNKKFDEKLMRLVCWSGRTEEAVHTVFEKLKSISLDTEFVGLLHNIQRLPIIENLYRGYIVLKNSEASSNQLPECVREATSIYGDSKRPIVWVFHGMGSQWPKMAQSLMHITSFSDSIMKCHKVLEQFGLDLISLITKNESAFENNILHCFVGINAVQIALIDLLKLLKVPSDYYVGHSVGELVCAYADETMSLEQTILSAYYRGKCSLDAERIAGGMAAIGMGYNEIKDILPPTIEVACRNSSTSCTISGPKNDVEQFTKTLQMNHVFAKEVDTCGIAYHSTYIANMGPLLLKELKKIIPDKMKRSSKWLSTSNPIDKWDTDLAKFNSAEYLTNNLVSTVYFEETCKLLPENAIMIEIGPTGLMQAILKAEFKNAIHIPLTLRKYGDQSEFLMMALGQYVDNFH